MTNITIRTDCQLRQRYRFPNREMRNGKLYTGFCCLDASAINETIPSKMPNARSRRDDRGNARYGASQWRGRFCGRRQNRFEYAGKILPRMCTMPRIGTLCAIPGDRQRFEGAMRLHQRCRSPGRPGYGERFRYSRFFAAANHETDPLSVNDDWKDLASRQVWRKSSAVTAPSVSRTMVSCRLRGIF